MADRVCWACKTHSHMTVVHGAHHWGEWPDEYFALAYSCDRCGWPSLGISEDRGPDERGDIEWLPASGVGRVYEDVPDHIAQAASEAHECRSINALRATAILARAVIEATAKEKGIVKGRLIEKIDALHAQGFIREYVRDGAHEVRHVGNDMAHGDFEESVDTDDADLLLALMAEVLREVFQAPAQVEKARAARLARKAGKSTRGQPASQVSRSSSAGSEADSLSGPDT